MKKSKFTSANGKPEMARLSGTINVSYEEESIYLMLRSLNIQKGNPIALSDQPVIAAGVYFGNTAFDVISPSDVQPYECNTIRKLRTEEVYIIGDLTTEGNQSKIQGFRIYVEAHDDAPSEALMEADGKFTVLEGQLVIFTYDNGNEECGLLVQNVNPLP